MSKAPRNRTIELNQRQISKFAGRAIKLSQKCSVDYVCDKVVWQDTFRALNYIPDSCVDLVVVDPPYNLTKVFSGKQFKAMEFKEYQKWLDKWLKKVARILKDNGSMYICADSFYMKLNPDGKTVAAMDCLVPGIGEIIGGSQREDDYEILKNRIEV